MNARAVVVRAAVVTLAAAAAAWAYAQFGAVYVAGESMSPALRRADLVIYRRDAAKVAEGDIVWVRKQGWPDGVLHRVHEITLDERLVLKGDANPVPDLSPSPVEDVRGVVVLVVPTGSVVDAVAGFSRMVQSHAT